MLQIINFILLLIIKFNIYLLVNIKTNDLHMNKKVIRSISLNFEIYFQSIKNII